MAENRKFNKKVIDSDVCYKKYDNYDAIEVSFTDAIPSDYAGVMGVPISFLDKYNPDQFEIVTFRKGDDGKDLVVSVERERERERERVVVQPYFRILIRRTQTSSSQRREGVR